MRVKWGARESMEVGGESRRHVAHAWLGSGRHVAWHSRGPLKIFVHTVVIHTVAIHTERSAFTKAYNDSSGASYRALNHQIMAAKQSPVER